MRRPDLPREFAAGRGSSQNPVTWIRDFSGAGFTRGGIVGERDVPWLARSWADALAATGCTTVCDVEFEPLLRTLISDLHAALLTESFDATAGYVVGRFLADNSGGDAALEATVSLVGRLLPMIGADEPDVAVSAQGDLATAGADPEITTRIDMLQGAIAAGYASRLREGASTSFPQVQMDVGSATGSYENWFRSVFRSAGIGMAISSLEGNFVEVNQAAADLFGYSIEEFREATWADLLDVGTAQASLAAYEALIAGDVRYIRMEQQYRRKDGALIWTNLTASVIRDASGTPQFTVAMVEDITEARTLREKLHHQATHDPLTGLPNRTLFFDRLAAVLRRDSAVPGARIGVCFLDLDRFKSVNDTLGHSVGDQLLMAVADRLRARICGPGTTIARMGGDEFVMLVEEGAEARAVTVAESALDALATPVFVSGNSFSVSASIGVVEQSAASCSPQDLMAAADMTLYWAKAQGRGRYEVFDPDRSAREAARIALAADLPEALRREEFVLEYQPIVSLADGGLVGVEALVRWHHPRLGMVPPGDFIGIAEETGAIVELGRWVLTRACEQAAKWATRFPDAGEGRGVAVSVNVAARQVWDSSIVDDVKEVLGRTGLPASLLQLELTENEIMSGESRSRAELEELASIGVGIAIDDFGTGYSNLSYLRYLPVTSIKVDKFFIDGLDDAVDPEELAIQEKIFGSIVSLAHALNLTVTAEGVESAEQAATVRRLGCDMGQGWLFGRPCTAEKITRALEARVHAFTDQAESHGVKNGYRR